MNVGTPFIMVIFGATGDLANNKLIPSLFSLYLKKQLPEKFYIIGFARREISASEFANLFANLSKHAKWKKFANHLMYQQGIFENEKGYLELIKTLNTLDEKEGACIMRLFYLATPPINYEAILNFLSSTKLSEGCGQGSTKWTRLIIEKPFGVDLNTSRSLDKKLSTIFEERQIFRVDHYLAKETVQNMLAFRFANGIFEPIWNSNYIDHVQITWAEEKGVANRGEFWEKVGLLRDVAQNHLMQLLAAVAMEQPKSFTKEEVRNVRAQAIKSIICISPNQVKNRVVRAQYQGYRDEAKVAKNSTTETFVAFKFFLDTKRFENVPFYVRAGKMVDKNEVTISVIFKQTCHILFKEYGCPEIGNVLTFNIQPNEGISLRVIAKKPGDKLALSAAMMNFSYKREFGKKVSDAYEKLLLDILRGDQMLFNRSDELDSSWKFITNILEGWKKYPKLYSYNKSSFGPKEANDLILKDGRSWL